MSFQCLIAYVTHVYLGVSPPQRAESFRNIDCRQCPKHSEILMQNAITTLVNASYVIKMMFFQPSFLYISYLLSQTSHGNNTIISLCSSVSIRVRWHLWLPMILACVLLLKIPSVTKFDYHGKADTIES